mmetsp:Transcript_24767/g.53864  ORF Transcript_24767/g.53864 Transcript_24767/m.53864 type:complete len:288 (-) Transcript_24767:46-909(-)
MPLAKQKNKEPERTVSAAELRRRKELAQDPYWRSQVFLGPTERKQLEDGWNEKHWRHFSRVNQKLNPLTRDYFDRPREERRPNDPSVRLAPLLATWSLVHEADTPASASTPTLTSSVSLPALPSSTSTSDPSLGVSQLALLQGESSASSSKTRPYISLEKAQAVAEKRRCKVREASWNGRHHVTHSVANNQYHDSQKELFGRYVQPRSKLTLPHRVHGITAHIFPHRQYGNENGSDDFPIEVEMMLRKMHYQAQHRSPSSSMPTDGQPSLTIQHDITSPGAIKASTT